MIQSFADADLRAIHEGRRLRRWAAIHRQVEKRLNLLDAATALRDLAGLPSNRLEKLQGDREGQHSIRVNDQWRLCFVWREDGPHEVEIVDYH